MTQFDVTQFRVTCPVCAAELALSTRRLLLRVDAGSATSGEVLFTCLSCRATATLPLTVQEVALLVANGVTFLSLSEPTRLADEVGVPPRLADEVGVPPRLADEVGVPPNEHPERPPSGPPLTHDDLLDLHDALGRDRWSEETGSLS
jgi:hypothetical protein